MRKWIQEWDRKRWLRKTGGLTSGDLATTLRIANMVAQQPKPTSFRAEGWLTAYRDLPVEKARLPRP